MRAYIAASIILISLLPSAVSSIEFAYTGKIESVRKGSMITILFNKKPAFLKSEEKELGKATIKIPQEDAKHYIIDGDKRIIGYVNLISAEYAANLKGRTRVVARYVLKYKKSKFLLRAGDDIVLIAAKKSNEEILYPAPPEKTKYKDQIVSPVDGRVMVLIPGGKFLFGSNHGDRDEYPEQVIKMEDYYIDKYEVSNSDYLKFVKTVHASPPISWKKGKFDKETADLPVLVTYHEAAAYAKWTGERLPTEMEWEKAARGIGDIADNPGGVNFIYPWGNTFDPDRANCLEFWSKNVIGLQIGTDFTIKEKGLLPVYAFGDSGASPYGIVNMSGNAKEWTSSWYVPYKGNNFANKKYGTQYKVVRGGTWYSNRNRVRVTSREPGGIPSLYKDNLAGFRCVKDPTIIDRE